MAFISTIFTWTGVDASHINCMGPNQFVTEYSVCIIHLYMNFAVRELFSEQLKVKYKQMVPVKDGVIDGVER